MRVYVHILIYLCIYWLQSQYISSVHTYIFMYKLVTGTIHFQMSSANRAHWQGENVSRTKRKLELFTYLIDWWEDIKTRESLNYLHVWMNDGKILKQDIGM